MHEPPRPSGASPAEGPATKATPFDAGAIGAGEAAPADAMDGPAKHGDTRPGTAETTPAAVPQAAPRRRPPARALPDGSRNANPPGIGFRQLVAEDFRTHDRDLLSQGFWTLFWHRFGNWRMSVRPKLLRAPLSLIYRIMFKLCEWLCGMKLSYNVPVGRRVRLDHFGGMVLGARAIGSDVILRQNTTLGIASPADLNAKPTISDGVQVGAGAVIVGDIIIGEGARIGANAVVTRDVPPGAVMGGNPARLVRMREGYEDG